MSGLDLSRQVWRRGEIRKLGDVGSRLLVDKNGSSVERGNFQVNGVGQAGERPEDLRGVREDEHRGNVRGKNGWERVRLYRGRSEAGREKSGVWKGSTGRWTHDYRGSVKRELKATETICRLTES